MVVHAGYDPVSPGFCHCPPAGAARVVKEFAGLKLVLAHLGGMMRWDEVEKDLPCASGLYLDTAYLYDQISSDQARRIIRKHGAEHILFGSDAPWHDPRKEKAFIQSLGLSREEEESIFFRNACGLLKISQK